MRLIFGRRQTLGLFPVKNGDCFSIPFEFAGYSIRTVFSGWIRLGYYFMRGQWSIKCSGIAFALGLVSDLLFLLFILFELVNLILEKLLFAIEGEQSFLLVLKPHNKVCEYKIRAILNSAVGVTWTNIVGIWKVRVIAVSLSESVAQASHSLKSKVGAKNNFHYRKQGHQ